MNEKHKRRFKLRLLLIVIISLFALFLILAAISFPLQTVYYTVYTDEITEPVRIVQISDLHSDGYGENMSELINAIDAAKPDIIVLTGDIYNEDCDNANTRALLKSIGGRYPCYYAAGNHEFQTPSWSEYSAEAESYGVNVLAGENAKVCGITICGAAQSADRSLSWNESVLRCSESADGYSVLLYHFPEEIEKLRSYGCFDLILSGHAHGGQWRVPFLINGIFAPNEGLFPKYAGGRYDFEDSTMIVSRGLLRSRIIVPRIFNNPELVVIDICPE